MTDFFLRSEDEKLAEGATFLDDIDTIYSPNDGKIVVVAVKHGAHVCWQCGELFNKDDKNLRGVETVQGTARVLLHAKCVGAKTKGSRSFFNIERGLQARRFFSKAVNQVSNVLGLTPEKDGK